MLPRRFRKTAPFKIVGTARCFSTQYGSPSAALWHDQCIGPLPASLFQRKTHGLAWLAIHFHDTGHLGAWLDFEVTFCL